MATLPSTLATPKELTAYSKGPDGTERELLMERVDRVSEGRIAYCDECETFIEWCNYWPLSKSVYMHRSGGEFRKGSVCRRVGYYRIVSVGN